MLLARADWLARGGVIYTIIFASEHRAANSIIFELIATEKVTTCEVYTKTIIYLGVGKSGGY